MDELYKERHRPCDTDTLLEKLEQQEEPLRFFALVLVRAFLFLQVLLPLLEGNFAVDVGVELFENSFCLSCAH